MEAEYYRQKGTGDDDVDAHNVRRQRRSQDHKVGAVLAFLGNILLKTIESTDLERRAKQGEANPKRKV